MQSLGSFLVAPSAQEISFANQVNQATLSQKGRQELIKGLLQHCYRFFDQAHLSNTGGKDGQCRRITWHQNNHLKTFSYSAPEVYQELFHSTNQQKYLQLVSNQDTRACMMHCTYLLAQALLEGHNEGIVYTKHNRDVIGITPETMVLNLLAEVDAGCASLHTLATSRAIQALCVNFFQARTNLQPLPNNNRSSIFNAKWIWTSQFEAKILPSTVKMRNERIGGNNSPDQEENKVLTLVSDVVSALLSKPTIPLYPQWNGIF